MTRAARPRRPRAGAGGRSLRLVPLPHPSEGVMKKHLSTLWSEFKTFAFKGNLLDLAVAVVLGAAFARLISAVVTTIVMPVISSVTPGPGRGYETWWIW